MENFDLSKVGGNHNITQWEPGTQVVFRQPIRISIMIPILFLFLGIGCFFLLWLIQDTQKVEIGTGVALGLLGSILGSYGVYGFIQSWSRTVIFDLNHQVITRETLLGKTVTPFSHKTEIVLQVNVYRSCDLALHSPKEYSLSLQIGETRGTTISFSQVCESHSDF